MKHERVVPIRLTEEEKRYAKAISVRSKYRCPRPVEGSVAHGLKCLLHERAEKEKVPLNNSSIYFHVD
jgi:hypothetical protein